MATISPSFSGATTFKKLTKGKRKKKESKPKEKTLTSKSNSKSKSSKENRSTELASTKTLVSCVQEPVWDTEYSEDLIVPVPDLYPELSDSLPNMQESDTEQGEMTKVCEPHCDSEDNVQCVPTSFGDNDLADDNHNNHGVSQSQDDSQLSNSLSQTQNSQTKRKRKLAKPRKVRKRKSTDKGRDTGTSIVDSERLHDSQVTGKQGTWAQCSVPSCGKWRFLQNNVDPNEIPERWVCSMNENDHYNACSASQETFDSQDGNLDVMYTPYPSGAIVWAKMVGYPWWPAMMEDDPDYGYYCETGDDNVTPVMYHVVFFDKEVSRTWVNAVCIRNFSCDDDPEDMGKVTFKGKNYRRQLTTATLAARRAAQMPLQRRLTEYGFAARYKGPIGRKAVEEKKRLVSLQAEEFSDSESSSQEMCSSGNSCGSGNSYSSPEAAVRRVKPKTTPKSKTTKEKYASKPAKTKAKKSAQTKQSESSDGKGETGKKKEKKAKKPTVKASLKTGSNKKDHSSESNGGGSVNSEAHHIDVSEPIHEQHTEGSQSNSDAPVLTGEIEPSVPSTLSTETDSTQSVCNEDKSVSKPSEKKSSVSDSSGTKVVKKRRISGEAQGGKKPKISKDAKANSENKLENSTETKEQYKAGENAIASSESLVKTQKNQNGKEESKRKNEKAAKVDVNHKRNHVKEDEGNHSELPTSIKATHSVSKEKEQQRISKEGESVFRDSPVEEESKSDKQSQSLDNETSCLKNQANKAVTKKKRAASSHEKRKSKESKKSSKDGASSSEVSDEKGACEDGVQPMISQKPSFALKRSAASTDVRVALSEIDSSGKKSLPKLVKAFKPPVAKEGKSSLKDPKMPKLLKPHFVSPALAKTEGKRDVRKEEGEEVAQSTTAKKNSVAVKEPKLKSGKAEKKDQCSSEKTKKTTDTEHDQANDVLPEDLQAEIDEIDNDIASMQKELRVSDTSDTSVSEERIISPTADHQFLSDSPEF